jgi:integrase
MLTLKQLDTLIAVSPENFTRAGAFAARRAVARIAQDARMAPAAVPAAGALEALDRLHDRLPRGEFSDLKARLARAVQLAPLSAPILDRIGLGAATFADVAAAAERQPKLWEGGRCLTALKRFAEKVSLALDQIPATSAYIETKFAEWTFASIPMKPRAFGNWRAKIRRAVGLVDLSKRQELKRSQLAGPWRDLLGPLEKPRKGAPDPRTPEQIAAAPHVGKLWPLVAHCYRNDVAPAAVSDETVEALHRQLVERNVAEPLSVARNAVYAWEKLQALLPSFPRQTLERVYKEGFGGAAIHETPWKELGQPFLASWDTYEAGHFGDGGQVRSMTEFLPKGPGRGRFAARAQEFAAPAVKSRKKKSAVANFKTALTYGANALIKTGLELTNIRQVASFQGLAATIDAVADRQIERGNQDEKSNYLYNTATMLITMATDLKAPEDELDAMRRMRDEVDPLFLGKYVVSKRTGKLVPLREEWRIGPKHERQLQAFNDANVVDRFLDMPYLLMKRAEAAIDEAQRSEQPLDPRYGGDVIVACYHGLSCCAPIRRQNFAEIRIDGREIHISLPNEWGTPGFIHVPATKTKNKKKLDIKLPPVVADWFRTYLRDVRPHEAGADARNPFLFPGTGKERHRTAADINRMYVARNRKDGGFKLNMQCSRHVAAKLILDKDPSKMALVQVLLGHKNIKTTERYYGRVNQILAQEWYQRLLAERHRERYERIAYASM